MKRHPWIGPLFGAAVLFVIGWIDGSPHGVLVVVALGFVGVAFEFHAIKERLDALERGRNA